MNSSAGTGKKDIFYIVVLILTFVVVLVGATFAIFIYLRSQEEGSSAVYTGTLSIEYISGNIINLGALYPIEEPSFEETENVYRNTFMVSSTGSLDSLIDINLNLNTNEFSNDTLMYNLYNVDGEVIANGVIYGSGVKTLASSITLENGKTEEYVLMIWINENNENQNMEMKKSLTGFIEVNANQKIE